MKYQDQFNKAIEILSNEFKLPDSGFLAGGSLANTVWNLVTGNPGPVNDIDVYRFVGKSELKDIEKKQHFKQKETEVYEDYKGSYYGLKTKNFYTIESVSNEGIVNFINYTSNTEDYDIILDSFDINCCQIGYNLETHEFHWTSGFVEFLDTGVLRLTNLTSPSHSAIRLVKKKNELEAELMDEELEIISYTIGTGASSRFTDTLKHRFMSRYSLMFENHRDELSEWFDMMRDNGVEEYLFLTKGITSEIYYLKPRKHIDYKYTSNQISLSKDFLFWYRKIRGDKYMEKMWHLLRAAWDTNIDYMDREYDIKDLTLLMRVLEHAPKSSNNLRGMKLSEQVLKVNKIFDRFSDDPTVAISILEKIVLDDNVNLEDDWNLLLLELSVRKEILEYPADKISRIMGSHQDDEYITKSNTSYKNLPF
jgi:hypothetical protein